MPTIEPPVARSIFLACFQCPICNARWHSRPLSQEEAQAVQKVLKMDGRGFRIVTCEVCWEHGTETPDVHFWFAEHPVH